MAISAPVPLYYTIIEYLMREIEDGLIGPDESIKSERELMEQFGMSRTTVRKALDVMVNEGYLYRIQGKGTFVAKKKREHGLNVFVSNSEEIKAQGHVPSYKVISCEVVNPRPSVARKLGISEEEKIFRLERVLYSDDEPVNITISHIPYKYVPGLARIDFAKNSLYNVLENDYGITICRSVRTIEATFCGDKDSGYLNASPNLPVLLFKGVMKGRFEGATDETVIEYFFSKTRSDKYELHIEQERRMGE
ncbi:MAG: GntR family transcriptional regulator [Lachnospiraceae bacterium]|nr:GntR family transcriptional regulator [Lachnospiraceae bacterium]